MISGVQKSEGEDIEWSDKLPEHTRLSQLVLGGRVGGLSCHLGIFTFHPLLPTSPTPPILYSPRLPPPSPSRPSPLGAI